MTDEMDKEFWLAHVIPLTREIVEAGEDQKRLEYLMERLSHLLAIAMNRYTKGDHKALDRVMEITSQRMMRLIVSGDLLVEELKRGERPR